MVTEGELMVILTWISIGSGPPLDVGRRWMWAAVWCGPPLDVGRRWLVRVLGRVLVRVHTIHTTRVHSTLYTLRVCIVCDL